MTGRIQNTFVLFVCNRFYQSTRNLSDAWKTVSQKLVIGHSSPLEKLNLLNDIGCDKLLSPKLGQWEGSGRNENEPINNPENII